MDIAPPYPTDKTYGAFLHRELSVSWLVLATLMGGRHRFDPGRIRSDFRYLDFGCGHGLNLLFNAAAHPQAHFYGLDLNPTHIAGATAKAEALGLGNVHFAQADLPPEDIVQLVLMGIRMAGATVKDPEGRPIEDPELAQGQLQQFWDTFSRDRLPVLRRLGLVPAAA